MLVTGERGENEEQSEKEAKGEISDHAKEGLHGFKGKHAPLNHREVHRSRKPASTGSVRVGWPALSSLGKRTFRLIGGRLRDAPNHLTARKGRGLYGFHAHTLL